MDSGSRSLVAENARIRVKENKFMASNEHMAKDFVLLYYPFLSTWNYGCHSEQAPTKEKRIKKR